MSSIFYVYIHTFSNGVQYIGKGCKSRYAEKSKRRRSSEWLEHYRVCGEPETTFKVRDVSEADAFKIEEELICEYRLSGVRLLNITDGGEGTSGLRHSKDSREKMSKAKRAKDNPLRGVSLSKEHKMKISKSHMGKVLSEEHRAKLSKSHIGVNVGDKNGFYDHSVHTFSHVEHGSFEGTKNELIKTFNLSASHVYGVVSGRRTHTGGWKYIRTIDT